MVPRRHVALREVFQGLGNSACLFLILAASVCACVTVRPLEDQRPAGGAVVQVGDQSVYTEQAGSGPPVVLVHGFGASSFSWRRVIPDLASRYRIVALDLNGFGWTERPRELESYTTAGQVALILGMMDALGLEDAHLVGHSYGGALAMALAAEHPGRLRSLTLVDSAAIDYPEKRRMNLARSRLWSWLFVRGFALRESSVERSLRRVYHDDGMVTDDLVGEYRERLRVEGVTRGFRGLTRPLPHSMRGRKHQYEEIHVPALVIWGSEDRLVTLEQGRAHAQSIPDHLFVTIEGSGHSPMEEKPAEFVEVLVPFLDEIERRLGDRQQGPQSHR